MFASSNLRRPLAFVLCLGLCGVAPVGCGGGPTVPTKIYEGGGTAPDVVDQPTKGAPRK